MPTSFYSDGVHLVTDGTVHELHDYAKSIGLKKCWFHAGSKYAHYDIPKRKLATFLTDHQEIKKISSREIVKMLVSTGPFAEIDRAFREGKINFR